MKFSDCCTLWALPAACPYLQLSKHARHGTLPAASLHCIAALHPTNPSLLQSCQMHIVRVKLHSCCQCTPSACCPYPTVILVFSTTTLAAASILKSEPTVGNPTLLSHLLVPALNGALPLPQVHHLALPVTKDLNLNVVGLLNELLNEHLQARTAHTTAAAAAAAAAANVNRQQKAF